jgi:hypothetical protein
VEIVIHINDGGAALSPGGGGSGTSINGSLPSSVTAQASTDIDAGAAPTPPDARGAPSTNVVAKEPTVAASQGDQSAGAAPSLS